MIGAILVFDALAIFVVLHLYRSGRIRRRAGQDRPASRYYAAAIYLSLVMILLSVLAIIRLSASEPRVWEVVQPDCTVKTETSRLWVKPWGSRQKPVPVCLVKPIPKFFRCVQLRKVSPCRVLARPVECPDGSYYLDLGAGR